MTTQLNWEKGLFSCTFNITSRGVPIGKLKDSELSRTAYGQLKDQEVAFRRCEGLLHSKASILDQENREQIGRISFNPWRPGARIELNGEVYRWSPGNIWETRWKIHRGADTQIAYAGWTGKGRIEVREQDDLLVLAGLYISNYYWRLAAVLLAVILPMLLFAFL